MSKLYKDKNWLGQKYSKEEMSDPKIAGLYKVTPSTIGYWRKKFNIITRSRGKRSHLIKANHCDLSQKAAEWINGELLGDGCIYSLSKYSAQFVYSSKFLEYIKYVSNTLKSFGVKRSGKIRKYYSKKMDCYTYQYESLQYEEFFSIRKRWYPNGKKVVPRNIKLTRLTIRQWFIGDGYLSHLKLGRPYITLSTNGFSVSDVIWLVKKLNDLGFKATRHNYHNSIYISAHSVKDFLNYIGPCLVECYQYKWDYYKRGGIIKNVNI